jgi:hypothetical protein
MKFVFFSVILFKTVFAGMPLKPVREIMMTLRERETLGLETNLNFKGL